MILKYLKILPVLAGTLNAPVLYTPKKASEPNYNFDELIYVDDELTNTYTGTYYNYDNGEPTNILRKTAKYISDWEQTPYCDVRVVIYAEDYYVTNETDNYKSVYQNERALHSIYIIQMQVKDVIGKIELSVDIQPKWNMIYKNTISNYTQIQKITYLVEEDRNIIRDGIRHYNISQTDVYSIYRNIMSSYIYNDYEQKEWESIITGSTTDISPYIEQDDTYTLFESQYTYNFTYVLEAYAKQRSILTMPTIYGPIQTTGFLNQYNPMANEQALELYYQQYNTKIVQEVIDIPDVMFTILTMPFAFISQAFNLTLFPDTAYSINISNLFLAILAILIFAFVMKLILGLKK